MLLTGFGILTLVSAVFVARHAGSTEPLLHRFPGLPMLSLSPAWVGLLASDLLRRGEGDGRPSPRRVASAALTAVTWLVLLPALLVLWAVISYTAAGVFGVLASAGFLLLQPHFVR